MPRGKNVNQHLWQRVIDKPLNKISEALYYLTPTVPLTPELKLYHAIFGERARDDKALLIDLFIELNEPAGEWEGYKDSCISWVTDLLQGAIAYETDLIREGLRQALETLQPRERTVVWLRFGFDGQGSRNLEQVGKEFNVTRERIRQVEAKALRKLRHPTKSRYLKHLSSGKWLQDRLFTEFSLNSTVPAIFLLWQEDREALKSIRKSHEEAIAEVHEDAENRHRTLQGENDYLRSLVKKVYELPITESGLSTRVTSALLRDRQWAKDMPTLGEVAVLTDRELLSIPTFGQKALTEVREIIRLVSKDKDHA